MADPRRLLALHMRAPNDTNGNPRRCYVVMTRDGAIVQAVDEGYSGWQAVCQAGYPNAVQGPAFDVTPSAYRALVRSHTAAR